MIGKVSCPFVGLWAVQAAQGQMKSGHWGSELGKGVAMEANVNPFRIKLQCFCSCQGVETGAMSSVGASRLAAQTVACHIIGNAGKSMFGFQMLCQCLYVRQHLKAYLASMDHVRWEHLIRGHQSCAVQHQDRDLRPDRALVLAKISPQCGQGPSELCKFVRTKAFWGTWSQ